MGDNHLYQLIEIKHRRAQLGRMYVPDLRGLVQIFLGLVLIHEVAKIAPVSRDVREYLGIK